MQPAVGEARRGPGSQTPALSIALVWPLLRSPELAVEPLDQALTVLVGLLVGPEVPDLLVAKGIEPRGDLIDVPLVVTGDRESGRR